MSDNRRMAEFLKAVSQHLPDTDETVVTITTALCDIVCAFADDKRVDSGIGFNEGCLDFWMDGKAMRVIIKRVADLDKQ